MSEVSVVSPSIILQTPNHFRHLNRLFHSHTLIESYFNATKKAGISIYLFQCEHFQITISSPSVFREISVLKQLAFQKFPRTLILPSDGVIKCLLRSKTGRTFLSIELLGEGYELLQQIFEKLKYTKVDRKPFMFGQSRHDVNHCRLTSCNLNQLVLEPDRIKF